MLSEQPKRRRFLLAPVSLVPNGRAHLGHLGGPLLKMDVLARHLRRRGDMVVLASTSDVHESHVAVKAYQESRPPEEVCNENFAKISADLEALDVSYDEYVNPLAEQWRDPYERHNTTAIGDLVRRGKTNLSLERIPFSPSGGRYIVGGWLEGRCPDCFASAGSYFCEKCGAHFRPEQILDPTPRFPEDAPLEWREERCVYLRMTDASSLREQWDRMALRSDFREIAERYPAKEGPHIRLTNPGRWGIPWPVPGSRTPQVIFTYSSLLWAPNLVCGDIYGQLSGEGVNAFDPDSEVKTVTSFGIDNAVPFLVGVLGTAIEQERYKPFDHYLVNYFYNLEGSKFSTNRGHVIWAADIIGLTPVGSDLVRFYLTLVNPEFEGQNFDVADFVDFNNRTVREIERSVRDSLRKRGERTSSSPSPRLLSRLEALIADQDAALDPSAFALKGASEAALRWLSEKDRLARDPNDHTWWLKSTALLLYPIMPKLSRVLWATCGHEKEPTTAAFLEVRNPGPAPRSLPLGSEINAKDLEPCLPGTLGEVRTGKTP